MVKPPATCITCPIARAFSNMNVAKFAANTTPFESAVTILSSCLAPSGDSRYFTISCRYGTSFIPTCSCKSWKMICIILNGSFSAAVRAMPANCFSASLAKSAAPLSDGTRRVSAVVCPVAALATATDTEARSRPVPAAMSALRDSRRCACVVSPVALTKVAKAGLSSSSAIAT